MAKRSVSEHLNLAALGTCFIAAGIMLCFGVYMILNVLYFELGWKGIAGLVALPLSGWGVGLLLGRHFDSPDKAGSRSGLPIR